MIVIIILVKKSVLLFGDTKVSSITISFPARESTVKFGILPVNGKNHFSVQLLTEN
jgi:hypothetical protein